MTREHCGEAVEALLSKPNTKAGRLQRHVYNLIMEHERNGSLPTSIRFLFYELEGRDIVPKQYLDENGNPKKRQPSMEVSEACTVLREAGLVPWRWLVDETRSIDVWRYADTVYEYTINSLRGARLDLWNGEPPPLILCESRSLAGILRTTASTYLCPIASTNGQSGGFLHTDLAPRVAAGRRVLYLGDYDFCGNHIERNTRRVLGEYGQLDWRKVAITDEHVETGDYPIMRKRDHRFKEVTYFDAVEAEALGQAAIQRILKENLDALCPTQRSEVRSEEERQRVLVHEAVEAAAREDAEGMPRVDDEDPEAHSAPDSVVEMVCEDVRSDIWSLVQGLDVLYPAPQRAALIEEITRRVGKELLQDGH